MLVHMANSRRPRPISPRALPLLLPPPPPPPPPPPLLLLLLVLLAPLAADAQSPCPNACSGRGECDGWTGTCACLASFGGWDCAQRLCPAGAPWAARQSRLGDWPLFSPRDAPVPCSAAGDCDAKLGVCTCYTGFGGAACEHTICMPFSGGGGNCTGQGRCLSMAALQALDAGFGNTQPAGLVAAGAPAAGGAAAAAALSYANWDAGRVYGCECDRGFDGADCSLVRCPEGDDPRTRSQLRPAVRVLFSLPPELAAATALGQSPLRVRFWFAGQQSGAVDLASLTSANCLARLFGGISTLSAAGSACRVASGVAAAYGAGRAADGTPMNTSSGVVNSPGPLGAGEIEAVLVLGFAQGGASQQNNLFRFDGNPGAGLFGCFADPASPAETRTSVQCRVTRVDVQGLAQVAPVRSQLPPPPEPGAEAIGDRVELSECIYERVYLGNVTFNDTNTTNMTFGLNVVSSQFFAYNSAAGGGFHEFAVQDGSNRCLSLGSCSGEPGVAAVMLECGQGLPLCVLATQHFYFSDSPNRNALLAGASGTMCLEAHGQTRNVAVWPCSSNAANNSQWSFNATTGALKSLGNWTRGLCLTTTTLPHAPAQADANAPVPLLAAVPSGTSYQVTVSDDVAFPNLVVVTKTIAGNPPLVTTFAPLAMSTDEGGVQVGAELGVAAGEPLWLRFGSLWGHTLNAVWTVTSVFDALMPPAPAAHGGAPPPPSLVAAPSFREHEPCSGAGLCDFTLGTCSCLAKTYSGAACERDAGLVDAADQDAMRRSAPALTVEATPTNFAGTVLQVSSMRTLSKAFNFIECADSQSAPAFSVRGDGAISATALDVSGAAYLRRSLEVSMSAALAPSFASAAPVASIYFGSAVRTPSGEAPVLAVTSEFPRTGASFGGNTRWRVNEFNQSVPFTDPTGYSLFRVSAREYLDSYSPAVEARGLAPQNALFDVRGDGLVTSAFGMTVSSGGLNVLSGGVSIAKDGLLVADGVTSVLGGLHVGGGRGATGDWRKPALTVNGTLFLTASGRACCGGVNAAAAAAGGVLALVTDNVLFTGASSLMGLVEVGGGLNVGAGGVSVRMGGLTVGAGGVSVALGGAVVQSGGASVLGGGLYAANDAASPSITAVLAQGGGRTAGSAAAFQLQSQAPVLGAAYTALLADNGGAGGAGVSRATTQALYDAGATIAAGSKTLVPTTIVDAKAHIYAGSATLTTVVMVDPGASIAGSTLTPGAMVDPGASISDIVLTAGSFVDPGASISGNTLTAGALVDTGAVISTPSPDLFLLTPGTVSDPGASIATDGSLVLTPTMVSDADAAISTSAGPNPVTTLTAGAPSAAYVVGMTVTGTNVAPGTVITAATGATTFTLSAAPTGAGFSGTGVLAFTTYAIGMLLTGTNVATPTYVARANTGPGLGTYTVSAAPLGPTSGITATWVYQVGMVLGGGGAGGSSAVVTSPPTYVVALGSAANVGMYVLSGASPSAASAAQPITAKAVYSVGMVLSGAVAGVVGSPFVTTVGVGAAGPGNPGAGKFLLSGAPQPSLAASVANPITATAVYQVGMVLTGGGITTAVSTFVTLAGTGAPSSGNPGAGKYLLSWSQTVAAFQFPDAPVTGTGQYQTGMVLTGTGVTTSPPTTVVLVGTGSNGVALGKYAVTSTTSAAAFKASPITGALPYAAGMTVVDSIGLIPAGATISSVAGNTITLNVAATGEVRAVVAFTTFAVGMVLSGTNVAAGTYITAATSSAAGGSYSVSAPPVAGNPVTGVTGASTDSGTLVLSGDAVQLGPAASRLVALRFTTGAAATMLTAITMQFASGASDSYSVSATLYNSRAPFGADTADAGPKVPDLAAGPAFTAASATASSTFLVSPAQANGLEIVVATLNFALGSWPTLVQNTDYFLVLSAFSASGTTANDGALYVATAAQTTAAQQHTAAVLQAAGTNGIALPLATPALAFDPVANPVTLGGTVSGWGAAQPSAALAVALLGGPPNQQPSYNYLASLGYAGDVVAIAGPAADQAGAYNVLALRAGAIDGSDDGNALLVDADMDVLSSDTFVLRTADVLVGTGASGSISLVAGRSLGTGGAAALVAGYGANTGGNAYLLAGDGLKNGGVALVMGGDSSSGTGGGVVLQPGVGLTADNNGIVKINDATGATRIRVDGNGDIIMVPASGGVSSITSDASPIVTSATALSLIGSTKVSVNGADALDITTVPGDVIVRGGDSQGALKDGGSVSIVGGASLGGSSPGYVRLLSGANPLQPSPSLRLEVGPTSLALFSDLGRNSPATVLSFSASSGQSALLHAGSLSVGGFTSFTSAAGINSFLTVSQWASVGTSLSVGSNLRAGGDLSVDGSSSLHGTVYTSGALSVNVEGTGTGTAAVLNGGLNLIGAGGAISLSQGLTAGDSVLTAGSLSVGGATTLATNAYVKQGLAVNGGLSVLGAANILGVEGAVSVGGGLSVYADLMMAATGTLRVNGLSSLFGRAALRNGADVAGSGLALDGSSASLYISGGVSGIDGLAYIEGAVSVVGGRDVTIADSGSIDVSGAATTTSLFVRGLTALSGGLLLKSGGLSLTGASQTNLVLSNAASAGLFAGGVSVGGAISASGGLLAGVGGVSVLGGSSSAMLRAGGLTAASAVSVVGGTVNATGGTVLIAGGPGTSGGGGGGVSVVAGSASTGGSANGGDVVVLAGSSAGSGGAIMLQDSTKTTQLTVDASGVTVANNLVAGSINVGGAASASSLTVSGAATFTAGFASSLITVCHASDFLDTGGATALCANSLTDPLSTTVKLYWNSDSVSHTVLYGGVGGVSITIASGAIFPVYF